MSDDNYRPILDQAVNGILHPFFRFTVQGRGRFVENQDRWILQQGPGDGQPLALSSR